MIKILKKFKNSNSDSTKQNSHFDTTQKFNRDNTQIAEEKTPKLNKQQKLHNSKFDNTCKLNWCENSHAQIGTKLTKTQLLTQLHF